MRTHHNITDVCATMSANGTVCVRFTKMKNCNSNMEKRKTPSTYLLNRTTSDGSNFPVAKITSDPTNESLPGRTALYNFIGGFQGRS